MPSADEVPTKTYHRSNRDPKTALIDAERARIGLSIGAIFSGAAVLVGGAVVWAGDRGTLHATSEEVRDLRPRVHAVEMAQAEQRQINAALLDAVRQVQRTLERLDAKIDAKDAR